MVWHPTVYARLLGQRIAAHQATVWLVKTGWAGGPYGIGRRISMAHTRAIIDAALSGALDGVEYRRDPVFSIEVSVSCPNVDAELLSPRGTWDRDADDDVQARTLAGMFAENFGTFASEADMDVTRAGPFS